MRGHLSHLLLTSKKGYLLISILFIYFLKFNLTRVSAIVVNSIVYKSVYLHNITSISDHLLLGQGFTPHCHWMVLRWTVGLTTFQNDLTYYLYGFHKFFALPVLLVSLCSGVFDLFGGKHSRHLVFLEYIVDILCRPFDVNSINSPTYKLPKFLAKHLQPYVEEAEYYVKNASHVIQRIKYKKLGPGHLLVNFNVVSLFTKRPCQQSRRNDSQKYTDQERAT